MGQKPALQFCRGEPRRARPPPPRYMQIAPPQINRGDSRVRFAHLNVEYWPILDPTGLGETREAKLSAYRQARDQIRDRMLARFGKPLV